MWVGGQKTAVTLSIGKYVELLEDLHDLSIIAERRDEPTVTFEDIKKGLKRRHALMKFDGRVRQH